ncbi:hypothetical protein C9374_005536 [Naegleria lovaniensis]|uniref:Uncharacterized protein n=1 Tax=Naegleria lovaniensis TaxID=51637 RepID=A0AA88GJW8_NAELO|nr:uncharacterized protein C9374_005536 [Naegleria lovaniensis]KAG2382334.1 hypothetical protein C9374_005536 [Naegleria lovaniensis]
MVRRKTLSRYLQLMMKTYSLKPRGFDSGHGPPRVFAEKKMEKKKIEVNGFNENAALDDIHATLFSFFNVLNVISGVDDTMGAASDLFTKLNEECTSNGRHIKAFFEDQMERLKKEEKEALEIVEVREHAKRLLQNELQKLEQSIEEARKKLKSITIASKCVKAAHSYLFENISGHKLASLSDPSLEKKLESFLWFLQNTTNPNSTSDSVTKTALTEFYKLCINLDDELSMYENYWKLITQSLMEQVKTSRPDIQHLQLGIISEICRKEEYSVIVREMQGFEFVSKLLKSINELVNGEACACITSFSLSPEHRRYLGEIGVIQNLLDLIWRTQNEESIEKAITALWHLVIDDGNKVLVRSCNGIPSICSLLKSSNIGILENTTIALGYLTRDDDNKSCVRESEGLKFLLDVLQINNDGLRSKAAGALWNCASNNENKIYLREIHAIPKLIDLLDSNNTSVLENVTGCLWNLAVDNDNKKEIFEMGGIPKLIQLLTTQQNDAVLENVTGTLWNCAALADVKITIRKANGMKPLLECMKLENENIRENAVGALRNCVINDQNKQALGEMGGIRELFVALGEETKSSIVEKIISTLWICSIENLNKKLIQDCGGIQILVSLLNNSSISIVEKTLGALRNCSSNVESIHEIREANAIPKLIELLASETASMREYAAATILNCLRLDEVKIEFRSNAGVEVLLSLLADPSENILENTIGALSILSSDVEIRDNMKEGFSALTNILETCQNEFLQENILVIFKNCSLTKANVKALGNENKVVPTLLKILTTSKNDNVTKEAVLCLKNLSVNEDNSTKIGKLRGLEMILHTINTSKNESLKKVCALTVQSLAKNPNNMKIIENLKKRSIKSSE